MATTSDIEGALWREIVDLILAPQPLSEGIELVLRSITRHLGVDSCAFHLLDQRTEDLVLLCATGPLENVRPRLRVGEGITGLAAYQRRPIHVAHVQQDPRSRPPESHPSPFLGIAAVPVQEADQLVGVLTLQHREVWPLDCREADLVQSVLPRLLLVVVHTAQTEERMRRRASEVQALNELGQAMNSGLGLDETLELITARAAEALHARGSILRLVVDDGTLALGTMVTDAFEPVDSRYEKRIAEYAAATGEPILIDDGRADVDPEAAGLSLLCVPLVLEERVVGTLSLFGKEGPAGAQLRLFGLDDPDMLFALSSQIAAEIEDIRMTVRLQELVRTEKQQGEELRGLYNRSRALLQSISDGLLAVSSDGTVEEVNAVASGILGYDASARSHVHIDELVEDKPPLREWLDSGGQFANRVITLRTQNGRVAAMANLQPVLDAGRRAVGAVLTFREMGEVGRLVNRVIGVQRIFSFDDIIGESAAIEKSKELARVAAGTSSSILIQGETGTGKEVFAQAIHNASAFSEGPFLAVNCAAIPRDLIESELFGYVEGAFTGASKKGRLGRFELSSGGTLFLDEVGDIPLEVQVKLLRVLQEKTIVRVGGDRTIPINCRLISATNRDLHQAVVEHRFRRDLLYRLNVIALEVPPLRQRLGDIRLFVQRFVHTFAERNGKVVDGVADGVLEKLTGYDWPGNVRELENAVEHAVAMVKGRVIEWDDLPAHLRSTLSGSAGGPAADDFESARQHYEAAIRQFYLEALRAEHGDILGAARRLGVSRATLYRRLRKLELQADVSRVRLTYQE